MCEGSIYIELIHIISGIICSAEELYNFNKILWDKLYKGDTESFYVYISEEKCKIDEAIEDAIVYKVTAGYWDPEISCYDYDDMERIK